MSTPNPALTAFAASAVTTHVPVPLQPPPDQPVNDDPTPAVAVNVIVDPCSIVSEHDAPQLMPAGVDVTVPTPVPDLVTETGYVFNAKFAVTVVAEVTATVHDPVPVQPPPDQPVNVDEADGLAINVRPPSTANVEHEDPQVISPFVEETVPEPDPADATDTS